MARPGVRFKLTHDKKTLLELPASEGRRERAFQLFGNDLSENLQEFAGERSPARVSGLIGKPNYSRGDRSHQEFYVNGRYIRNASLTHALYDAYHDLIMRDRHPVGFIFLDLDPALVDVNVHPAKAEVRFRNQSQVHDLVRDLVREALRNAHGPAMDSRPERAREAVADYFESAERGVRSGSSAEFGLRSAEWTPGAFEEAESCGSQSALAIPHSELPVPLAQVHDSFIVAQTNDGMALIDQHAAHERVLFEKLQDQYAAGAIPVQSLLIPVQVELGHAGTSLLKEHLDGLGRIGFLVEHFGEGAFMIKGVPALMTGGDYKGLLIDILDEIKVHGANTRMDRLRDELLSVMACHPAIKIHRKLSLPEMGGLIRDLFACRMPHSCPHGRPTVVRFAMDEIRRMFKRI
jgi:DNA mismatch repair protein MutL